MCRLCDSNQGHHKDNNTMDKLQSDIEIARSANIKPITEILKNSNIPDDPYALVP